MLVAFTDVALSTPSLTQCSIGSESLDHRFEIATPCLHLKAARLSKSHALSYRSLVAVFIPSGVEGTRSIVVKLDKLEKERCNLPLR